MLSRASSLVTIVSTLFNACTAACCALIGLRVLCKDLHSHARPCAANSEASYSQHYVRNPCTTLRSELFKRIILCFISCEVCHALSCHSLNGTHRQLLCSAWLLSRYTTQMVVSTDWLIYLSWWHAPPIALLCLANKSLYYVDGGVLWLAIMSL